MALTNEVIYQKSSQELTALLYEGMMNNLEQAIELIEKKDFIQSNQKLQKSNDILKRLGIGLKYEAGPIAEQLDTLYNYLANQLITANIKKDISIIKNVLEIIEVLAKAWNEALKTKSNAPLTNRMKQMTAYDSHVMRTQN